jgi:hypothetical protein
MKRQEENKKKTGLERDIDNLVNYDYLKFHSNLDGTINLSLWEIIHDFRVDFYLLMALAFIDRFVIVSFS